MMKDKLGFIMKEKDINKLKEHKNNERKKIMKEYYDKGFKIGRYYKKKNKEDMKKNKEDMKKEILEQLRNKIRKQTAREIFSKLDAVFGGASFFDIRDWKPYTNIKKKYGVE